MSDRDFIIVTNDDAFIISIIGLVRYILQIRSYIMKNTRINNPIAYTSNRSSYDICLRAVECSIILKLRSINFYYLSNFVTELADDFLLTVIIENQNC